ncbi:LCP family protein [Leucobacter sp. M11]|uniref:LCP family protein n=1 Tax=Leucobacter sp. M11 TaxID=2993565 RepID=UPI002D7EA02E|nr:LCP family protein [Leucobacter sp. M11]MEB4615400.1 LCP family protein [Leucobacter sp. M11]
MSSLNLETPLRTPDTASPVIMTKRAWWLVLIGFLLPGSAQVLAGKRGLGRFGIGASITLFLMLVAALVVFLIDSELLFTFFTNGIVLLVLQGLLIGYAILWVVLGFDTLRLAKIIKAKPGHRPAIAVLSILLTLLPAAGAAWAATLVQSGRDTIGSIFGGGAPAVEPIDGRYNILMLGADAGDDREGLRPDSISLISVDAETGQSVVIGLPRELQNMPFLENSPMAPMYPEGYGTYNCEVGLPCYLNGVYAEGQYFISDLYPEAQSQGSEPGIEATKDAVSGATGLDVQFYVMIDMVGFEKLINALGGVDINVQERLPIGGDAEGNGVEGYVEAGQRTLDGFEALWYARSRYSTDDYDRMRRQRELQSAILAQMNPANVLLRFQEVAGAGAAIVTTDIPESMLGRFVKLATKAKDHTPVTVNLTPENGVDPFYADYEQIYEMVRAGVVEASAAEKPAE